MSLMRRKNRKRTPLKQRVSRGVNRTAVFLKYSLHLVITVLFVASIPTLIYFSYHRLMRSEYFMIDTILLEGNERVEREHVLHLLNLEQRRTIFSVNEARMADTLMQNPWIASCEVLKELPRSIEISIQEREAVGSVYLDRLYLVDGSGDLIEAVRSEEIIGPIITGVQYGTGQMREGLANTEIQTALELAAGYAESGLTEYDDLVEIHFDELMGFSLLTAEYGLEIRLGHDRYTDRLARLVDVFNALEGEPLHGRYILLDGNDDLVRVAVGPILPGRVESGQLVQGSIGDRD